MPSNTPTRRIPGLSRRPLSASVADQSLFVDREAETKTILASIELGLNTFVTGPAGSGKTSLLHRVQSQMQDSETAVKYVNAESATSIDAVLVAIATSIDPESPAGSSWSTVAEDETDLFVIEESVAARFEDGRPVVVLVDGLQDTIATVLFGRYRDRLWETPQIRWVVASRHQAPPAPADAFFDRVVELAPLSKMAAKELLERRVPDLESDTRDRLVSAIGTAQPVFWVLAAQSLALSVGDSSEVIANLEAERVAIGKLPGRLKRLYEAVVELGPVHAGNAQLLERLAVSRPAVVSGLKELENEGFVQSNREGQRVLYDALRNWLLRSSVAVGTGVAGRAITRAV